VRLIFAAAGLWRDPLNKPHDGAAQFFIFDTHERLYQSQAIRRCKEIGNVGGRGRLLLPSTREDKGEGGGDGMVARIGDAHPVWLTTAFLVSRRSRCRPRIECSG